MKPFSAILLIILLVLTSSLLGTTTAQTGYPCNLKCQERCALAGEEKRCLDYCGICCKICQCVPPGTSGNKSACPCYEALRNSKGTSKCP